MVRIAAKVVIDAQGRKRCASEESEVIKLVREGNMDVFRRKNPRSKQKKKRKRKQKSKGENKWCIEHILFPSSSYLHRNKINGDKPERAKKKKKKNQKLKPDSSYRDI